MIERRENETDTEFFKRDLAEQRRVEGEKLQQAKAKAILDGKEAFDIDALHQFRKHRRYDDLDPETKKMYVDELEYDYYVKYSDVFSLKEYGEKLKDLDRWIDDL